MFLPSTAALKAPFSAAPVQTNTTGRPDFHRAAFFFQCDVRRVVHCLAIGIIAIDSDATAR